MRVILNKEQVAYDGVVPRAESVQVPLWLSARQVERLDSVVPAGSRSALVASALELFLDMHARGEVSISLVARSRN